MAKKKRPAVAKVRALLQRPDVLAVFQAWGRSGGKKRARLLSAERRAEIATTASAAVKNPYLRPGSAAARRVSRLGGDARAKSLTKEQRRAIAQKASLARWSKTGPKSGTQPRS